MEEWKDKYDQLNETFNSFKRDYEEFIHFAVHDLDAPVRKLSSFIDRFTKKYNDLLDEEAKKYITRIEGCSMEIRSLIDSLYQLSLVSNSDVQLTECDLNQITREVLNNMQEEVKPYRATFHIAELPTIRGSKNQLLQLFRNLFDNAVRFSKKEVENEISVSSEIINKEELTTFHLKAGVKYYKIIIKDKGIGFKQEYAKKIFKPFIRLHGRSEIPGNGLGLAVCEKIVKNHSGIIYAEGDENLGSRFVLVLPQSP